MSLRAAVRKHAGFSLAGFSLIEAAVVLGVIGLVVAAIWVAVPSVQSQERINNLADQALLISRNISATYPKDQYPQTNGGGTDLTSWAYKSGQIPAGFTLKTTTTVANADGVVMNVRAECYTGAGCPRIALNIYGYSSNGTLTGAECYKFMMRVAGVVKTADFMYRMSVVANDGSTVVWAGNPPFDMSSFSCPDNFNRLALLFSP